MLRVNDCRSAVACWRAQRRAQRHFSARFHRYADTAVFQEIMLAYNREQLVTLRYILVLLDEGGVQCSRV